MARGPQKTTRLVRGGPLVTIILSNRTITTHNNGQYKTHYRYSRKSKTFVLNDCNVKIEVTEFGKEFQIDVQKNKNNEKNSWFTLKMCLQPRFAGKDFTALSNIS